MVEKHQQNLANSLLYSCPQPFICYSPGQNLALRISDMNDQNDSHNWGDEMDRDEHETTYDAFLNYSKWGSVAVIAILLFLLVFVYD